jgi:LuxR family maltose regulon positive regulatory protein
MTDPGSPVTAFKTTAPTLVGMVARPALVQRLLERPHPGCWLTAPSGTGKSTLVAQYALARPAPLVWYRLDARDDDPAFFHRHFGAAMLARCGPVPMPAFSSDDRPDVRAFNDRLIASLAAVPGVLTLVLDDMHRVGDALLLDLLAALPRSLPGGSRVVYIGEEPPPAAFFDAIAGRSIGLASDLDLSFDAASCAALAGAADVRGIDGETLAATTGGHAGAVVLACELMRGREAVAGDARAVTDRIHAHLLGQLLDRLPAASRELLLHTAFAPFFDAAIADSLAGAAAAAQIPALVERGLLRRAMSADQRVYEAHGLVRRGLQSLIEAREGSGVARERALRNADALATHGHDEAAFNLLIEHHAVDRALAVVARLAPRYARAGQSGLLARALDRLPAPLRDTQPWLSFWEGQALLGANEERARAAFARSHAAFAAAEDGEGMRLAAASVVIAYGLEYGDLRELDDWMSRYADAGGDRPVPPGCAYESVLCMAATCAAIIRGAWPPDVDADATVARLQRLVDDDDAWLTVDQRVSAARLLVDHARIFRNGEQAQQMVIATSAAAGRSDASALQRGRWCIAAAGSYIEYGQPDAATRHLEHAAALVAETGSRRLAFELGIARVDASLKLGRLDDAAARLAELELLASTATPAQRADHARLAARVLLLQGRHSEGLRWATEALANARRAGFSGGNTRIFQVECVYALAANDRYDEALTQAIAMTQGLASGQREAADAIVDALRFLASGGTNRTALERALRQASDRGFVNLLSRARVPLARLCRHALVHGVEPEFVRRIIDVQGLEPPDDAGPEWPWPVVVHTLGRFEILIGGRPYRPAHKAQDKPLELLKLLVTCRVLGRASADKTWIAERLWPDADEPNARKSLDMTISRLRRLLQHDDAVTSIEGRVELAPTRVWTDVAPLLRALRQAGDQRDGHARGAAVPRSTAVADVTAVLDQYRGAFLPGEGDAPWLIAGREAVAGAVRSALMIADAVLAGTADLALAGALERAMAADPTSEDIARALMRLHLRAGHASESLRVYRRVREMLSIVLGMAPSPETEKLKQAVQHAAVDHDRAVEPATPPARVNLDEGS